WAMYGINALTGFTALQPVSDQDEHVRGWAVRLLGDDKAGVPNGADYVWKGLTTRARQESSPLVRRELASLVLRLAAKDRQPLLAGLLSHAEDASDHNLPFLYWYALEPLAGQDPKSALDLAANGKIPILLQFTARRIATTARKQENELLAAELAKAADGKSPDVALMILRRMTEGFRGRKDVPAPADWSATADKLAKLESPEARSLATSLSITFGDERAFAAMRKVLVDPKAPLNERQNALAALVNG